VKCCGTSCIIQVCRMCSMLTSYLLFQYLGHWLRCLTKQLSWKTDSLSNACRFKRHKLPRALLPMQQMLPAKLSRESHLTFDYLSAGRANNRRSQQLLTVGRCPTVKPSAGALTRCTLQLRTYRDFTQACYACYPGFVQRAASSQAGLSSADELLAQLLPAWLILSLQTNMYSSFRE
jgi:hypothetical protein